MKGGRRTGAGRPPGPAALPIPGRLTQAELDALSLRAAELGLSSGELAATLVRAAIRPVPLPGADGPQRDW